MKRRVAGWLLTGLILLWVGSFLLTKTVAASTTEDMMSVAGKLRVPVDWPVVSEMVETEKLFCLNSNECPSLSRIWQADRELQPEDLHELGKTAGWILEIDGDCLRQAGDIGSRTLCTGVTTDGGYDIQLRIESPDQGAASQVGLHLGATEK